MIIVSYLTAFLFKGHISKDRERGGGGKIFFYIEIANLTLILFAKQKVCEQISGSSCLLTILKTTLYLTLLSYDIDIFPCEIIALIF